LAVDEAVRGPIAQDALAGNVARKTDGLKYSQCRPSTGKVNQMVQKRLSDDRSDFDVGRSPDSHKMCEGCLHAVHYARTIYCSASLVHLSDRRLL
jgi:hypothetical protein